MQKTTEKIPRGLVAFQNTEELAVAVILKNSTYFHLEDFNKWYAWSAIRAYVPMPSEIPPFSAHGFGFTFKDPGKAYDFGGSFSFRIQGSRFVVMYGVWEGCNRFGLAFIPPNIPVDGDLGSQICRGAHWSSSQQKCKVYAQESAGKMEIRARLQFGSITAEATMTKGRKAVLTIEIK